MEEMNLAVILFWLIGFNIIDLRIRAMTVSLFLPDLPS